MRGQPPGKNRLQQIHDPHRSNIRLGGIGVVVRDRLDVIAADRDRPLRSELLVDLVNADLPQFVSGLVSMKADQNMADVDDFDFICHVAYDKKPLTRRERANNVKKRDFLSKYSGVAREVLEALLDKYMNSGIYEIEKTEILRLDPFMRLGKPAKIASYFGGKAGYLKAIQELEDAIYMDEAV